MPKNTSSTVIFLSLAMLMVSTPFSAAAHGDVDPAAFEERGPLSAVVEGPREAPAEGEDAVAPRVGPGPAPRGDGLYDGLVNYNDVLLVVNNNSQMSRDIGAYFAQARGITYPNHVNITAPTSETISRTQFNDIRGQIEDHITAHGMADELNYIVTTKGVPLRVSGSSNQYACLDSELTLILGPYADQIGNTGWVVNPYGGADQRFDSGEFGIYLVTRLTGYFYDGVISMIDNTTDSLGSRGQFVLDVDPGKDGSSGYKVANDWMRNANATLHPRGHDVFLDETTWYVTDREDVFGYSSWGSNDGHDTDHAKPHNTWVNGSIAETFVSTGGRTMTWGPASVPPYSGQSLIADWLKEGVNGMKGYVYEPFLSACAHTDILMDRYTRGYSMAESYYMASAMVGWQDVVVGDPKMAPFVDTLLDLEIGVGDVECDPAVVNEGDEVGVSATVRNVGGSDAAGADIQFYMGRPDQGGKFMGERTGVSIPAGDSGIFELHWNTTDAAGSKEVFVRAVLPSTVIEQRSGNNMGSAVFSINQKPVLDKVTAVPEDVPRGETLTLEIGVSDGEQANSTLVLLGRYSRDGSNWADLPGPEWDHGSGCFVIELPVGPDFQLGGYDVELRLEDSLSATHGWEIWEELFQVVNVDAWVTSVGVLTPRVFRGAAAQVLISGGDLETVDADLTPMVQYMAPSGTWTDLDDVSLTGEPGLWLAEWDVPMTAKPGAYDTRARLSDGEPGAAYYPWVVEAGKLEIMNNLPSIIDIIIQEPVVYRGSTVLGSLNVSDIEDPPSRSKVQVQMALSGDPGASRTARGSRDRGDGEWMNASDTWNDGNVHRFELITDLGFTAGMYDVRARAMDLDGDRGPWSYLNATVHIANNPPELGLVPFHRGSVGRGTHVELSARVDDEESPLDGMRLSFNVLEPGGENVTMEGELEGAYFYATYESSAWHATGWYEVSATLSDNDADEPTTVMAGGARFHLLNDRPEILDAGWGKRADPGSAVRVLILGWDADASLDELALHMTMGHPDGEETLVRDGMVPSDPNDVGPTAESGTEEWEQLLALARNQSAPVWVVQLEPEELAGEGRYTFSLRVTDADGGDSGWATNGSFYVTAPSEVPDGGGVTDGGGPGGSSDGVGEAAGGPFASAAGRVALVAIIAVVAAVLVVPALLMFFRSKKAGGRERSSPPISEPAPGLTPSKGMGTVMAPKGGQVGPKPRLVRGDGAPGEAAVVNKAPPPRKKEGLTAGPGKVPLLPAPSRAPPRGGDGTGNDSGENEGGKDEDTGAEDGGDEDTGDEGTGDEGTGDDGGENEAGEDRVGEDGGPGDPMTSTP